MEKRVIKRFPLGNIDRKWRQEEFIISTFSGIAKATEKGLQRLKDAHFNLVEMGWVSIDLVDGAIKAAEKVGVDVLVQDWRYFGGFQDSIGTDIVDGEIEKCIEKCQSPHVLGYYVWDEPYMPKDLERAGVQTDIMERLDDKRLPFSVAIPSYNGAYQYGNDLYDDYLERYVSIINPPVFSIDHYPFHFYKYNDEGQLDECNVFKDLYLMRKHGLRKGAPLWYYYQGMDYFEFAYISPIKMGMGAYLALLYGAKAMQHYTALGAAIDDDGEPMSCYEDVKKLNERFVAWGNTLMALTSTGVFHDDSVLANDPKKAAYTDDFSSSKLFDGALPHRISVGELCDMEGNQYVLILNRDYLVNRTFSLPLKKEMRVYEVSKQDGTQALVESACNTLTGDLAPGECIFLRLQDTAEEPYLIEYELQK